MRIFLSVCLLLLFMAVWPVVAQDETESPLWPEQAYAPYVYAGGGAFYQMAQLAETTGVRYYTLSFVLNGVGDCQARWGGSTQIDQRSIVEQIQKLRDVGGDVIVAFGGWGGEELGMACTTVESLQAEYQRVIDSLGVTHLDFDIEGDDIHDPESIDRRSQAIAGLVPPGDAPLEISFTLPVQPTGLNEEALFVLESAIEHGVEVGVVNIMTMNFGADFPQDEMGANAVQAAESLFAQLEALYPDKSEDDIWNMIGITPMIGLNDVVGQIFTLDDAQIVADFAAEKPIRRLAMWAFDRDFECISGAAVKDPDCSGTLQDDYAYSLIFNRVTD